MYTSKITFVLLFTAISLVMNAQEKKKEMTRAKTTEVAPAQAQQRTAENEMRVSEEVNTQPVPVSQGVQQTSQQTQQPETEQIIQAVPQTTTNGDKPVEGQLPKQLKDRRKKGSERANIQQKKGQK